MIIVILVVCLVIFAGRINKQNKEMLDAEDMIAQLANANKDVNPELLQKLGLDKPEVSEELEAPQAETADEKLADAVIDGSTGSEIPTVQEAEQRGRSIRSGADIRDSEGRQLNSYTRGKCTGRGSQS